MRMLEDVIIKPVISERSMDLMGQRKYVFKVAKAADKAEIANAVEAMFPGTKVEAVNTINVYDILNADTFITTVAAVKMLEEVYA